MYSLKEIAEIFPKYNFDFLNDEELLDYLYSIEHDVKRLKIEYDFKLACLSFALTKQSDIIKEILRRNKIKTPSS